MPTTIQISEELKRALGMRKISDRETYEEVIWNLIEDVSEITEETKRELEMARKEIREGKVKTLSEVRNVLDL